MKTKLIRILRLTTDELDPSEGPEELPHEEFETLPEYEPNEEETKREGEAEMLLRVKGKGKEVDMEMMKKVVNIHLDESIFKEMLNIFELYRVPFKPIENGIEVDIRRIMREKT